MIAQSDLFAPSGPQTAVPGKSTYRGYLQWRDTPEGGKAYGLVAHGALTEFRSGAERISIKRLCEQVRHLHHIEVNNTHASWIADSLIDDYPQLKGVIERRARKKAKTL